jgi:glycosyltransferase involved in cell wall biosynthesis
LPSKLISVVIPTHNRASMVGVAIASVLQSPLIGSAEQIIVVDDDSEDETEQVVRPFGVRYVRVACRSSGATRNAGFALVQTPYVAFLDDDDVWLPGNLEEQLSALEARPGAGFAYGLTQCANDDLEPLPWTYPSPPLASGIVPERLHLDYPQLGVMLFRREAVAEAEGFDSGIPYYQDADLMLRIAAKHEIVGVSSVGMLHRLRAPSRSRDDYYWSNRDVITWRPKGAGIGWRTTAKYFVGQKSLFYWRLVDDASGCAINGQRRDALICLLRAAYIAPHSAVHHPRRLVSVLRQSLPTGACAAMTLSRGSGAVSDVAVSAGRRAWDRMVRSAAASQRRSDRPPL